MDWLLLSAVLLQMADASYTCNKLSTGKYHETNPFLGNSCKSVILMKSAAFTPLLVLHGKPAMAWKIGLAVGGGVGITFSIALDK